MKKQDTKIEIVKELIEDFEARKQARKPLEQQWQQNIDFLRGNQNVNVGKRFYWQQNEVFNHISTLVEARLAKLTDARAGTSINVVPLTADERDIKCAEKCEKIIKSAFKKINMENLVEQANMWAEMTGTAFYKVVWNNMGGRRVGEINGKAICEGDISVIVCSPFEIYPDSLTAGDITDAGGIIHAKPYTRAMVRKIWGRDVGGTDIDVYDFNRINKTGSAVLRDAVMVIERYREGRLTIVAGDKLLFDGEYDAVPFVRQTSESMPGSFFGKSVIERAIPVQKAYNAVKNRKTEFLNRLACGVLATEDGSVDIDALENDGLAPGAIIVYRQGSAVPKFMDAGGIPAELEREEERLLREFATITGGSDITRGDTSNVSGVALEIMVAQDKLRIRRAVQSSQNAVNAVASHILGLYKKYGVAERLERLAHGKCVEMFMWSSDDITSDEVTTI